MRQIVKVIFPTLAVSLLLAACGSSSSSTSSSSSASSAPGASQTSSGRSASVVKTASNSTLAATILVNAQGMTLYHLSAEQNGKWICTSAACVQAWHPLIARSGSAPKGTVGSLATVKRPDGTMQVTYKSTPLYTFAQDQKAGDAKGQGIKDVGTWTAVTAGAAASSTPTTSNPSTSSSGGGHGY
jgi:predicted lipoprotein with Yx(FWY)xxD motif